MFTGLIEEVGTIDAAEATGDGRRFRIRASTVLERTELGDSISIDGACHTVTALHRESFEVQSIGTTLQRTALGGYRPGRRVNLERAMTLDQRLGGHLVQGHVDGVGEILAIDPREGHVLIDFTLPPLVAEVTILHGSITLNGISLTVNGMPRGGVAQVSIIPHTWSVTAIRDLKIGDAVNLEGDMIGKYVRRLLDPYQPGDPHIGGNSG